jgi:hypothetical protein
LSFNLTHSGDTVEVASAVFCDVRLMPRQ